jgi:ribulose-phosphate 3-epimerase
MPTEILNKGSKKLMRPSICPTVTAPEPHTFREQMERIAGFAVRVHIDLSDGSLAPNKLLDLDKVWWPGGIRADLHVMLADPFAHVELYRALGPQLVIVHAEAKGDYAAFAEVMHHHGIETGIALLPDTDVEAIVPGLELIDHVMIFSGKLGYFGGDADLQLLDKVKRLKQLKPMLEIGWDGGINDRNARQLVDGGVDVLNVGGFIQHSPNAAAAYDTLEHIVTA